MLDFDQVQQALERLGASADAAESHGTLSGLLISKASMADWLSHTLDDLPDKSDVLAAEQVLVLNQLFELTREQLNDEDFGLELLLPDDCEDFAMRLLGISTWCQGFLYGVGASGGIDQASLDETSQECLSDLLEISKLSHDAEASEEAEQQYLEIVEHVRMATLTLNESLNPVMSAPALQ
jgi:hypothetical protein